MIDPHAMGSAPVAGASGAPLDAALVAPPRGTVTFFYYFDLAAAAAYYRDVIGLRPALVLDWCVIFELGAGARLGLVDAVAGSQRPIAGPEKGALLSIEVDDVEACLQRLRHLGAAAASTGLQEGCRGLTREFKVMDPGGYTVEFFCWAK